MAEDSGEHKLDATLFYKRLKAFYAEWRSAGGIEWGNAEMVSVLVGTTDDNLPMYQKSTALHHWLLDSEFTETLMVFSAKSLLIHCTQKKLDILKEVATKNKELAADIELVMIPKQKKEMKEGLDAVLAHIKKSAQNAAAPIRIGHLAKDQAVGDFSAAWKKVLEDKSLFELADVSNGFSVVFAVKDEAARACIDKAARFTSGVLKKVSCHRYSLG
jgi:nucleosome binding factor SPN SPT16 subunit